MDLLLLDQIKLSISKLHGDLPTEDVGAAMLLEEVGRRVVEVLRVGRGTSACNKLIATLMVSLAGFEHDLLHERGASGIAAAIARSQTFGRRLGYRPSDRHAQEAVRLSRAEKISQREIAERLGIS